jgi:hypothetical protein
MSSHHARKSPIGLLPLRNRLQAFLPRQCLHQNLASQVVLARQSLMESLMVGLAWLKESKKKKRKAFAHLNQTTME